MRSAWKRWASVVVLALGASGLGAGCVAGSWGRSAERSAEREVLERILRSSVQIVLEQNGDRFRTGSGVIIGVRPQSDCYVLTSAHTFHAISPSSETYVLLDRHQGEGMRGRAEVLALRDTDEVDLALLETRGPGCRATPLGRPPALGDRIWIVGFPWGRQLRLIGGIVSQIALDDHGRRQTGSTLMVDASVAYGMSGGGVFDALSGRLVGLVQGYGTARVPFGEKAALQYIDVPVPGETYVTSVETIDRFLRDAGHPDLAAAPRP
jgi:trypsin-like peptidase